MHLLFVADISKVHFDAFRPNQSSYIHCLWRWSVVDEQNFTSSRAARLIFYKNKCYIITVTTYTYLLIMTVYYIVDVDKFQYIHARGARRRRVVIPLRHYTLYARIYTSNNNIYARS